MAGTLPGIPLSQQFSAVGRPLPGCLLYFYAANTTTPQDSFLDQGLTIKNPWPLAADNSGRVPMFYLADGSIHVRLTDNGGVVQFDYPSMMVVGPSSGTGGGGGTSVDPTTIFQTGDVMWLDVSGPRTGWVRDNGRTISNLGGGGSERAAADCQALFVFLWNTYPTFCPVTGGRGANGLADFNAGKQITLPDKRGFIPGGLDDMGNSAVGRYPSVPIITGSVTTPGSWIGESIHQLNTGEIPTGLFSLNFTDPGHTHTYTATRDVAGAPTHTIPAGAVTIGTDTIPGAFTNISASITDHAGNGTHNNTPYTVLGTFFRKL